MGKILGYLFAAILAVTFVGLDYVLAARKNGEGPYPVSAYVRDRIGGMPEAFAGLDAVLKPPRLEDMIPPAPEGWSVRRVSSGDFARVTGLSEEDERQVEKAQILGTTAIRLAAPGYRSIRRFYETDGAAMIVEIHTLPPEAANGPAASQLAALIAAGEALGGARPYATVDGMALVAAQATDQARAMFGRVGTQFHIGVLTSADDAGTFAVLDGLDVAGLNGMLAEPVPGLGQGGIALVTEEGTVTVSSAEPAPEGGRGIVGSLLGLVRGNRAAPAEAAPGGLDPADIAGRSPDEIAAAIEGEFAAVQSALDGDAPPEGPKAPIGEAVGRLTDKACDTKAGTKFCAATE